jgi:hypothetical protein
MCPEGKELVRNSRCHSKAARCIFDIDHHQVDGMGFEHMMQMSMDNPAPGATENVSNKENSHKNILPKKRWTEFPMVAFLPRAA